METTTSTTTTTTLTPRNHRRTYSDEKGPGAFASLGSLPKFVRKTPTTKKQPVFRFNDDDDDDDDEEDEEEHSGEEDYQPSTTTTYLPTAVQSSSPTQQAVPFPRRSESLSPPPDRHPIVRAPALARPSLTRGVSTPTIILSTGKPLKSSLKSSSSSPSVTASPVHEVNSRQSYHTRAASAPATPNHHHKAVHFPDNKDGGLEDVRLFNRSAKPQAVSRIGGEETETETEPEFNAFPFPRFSKSTNPYVQPTQPVMFEINRLHPGTTSSIPAIHPPYDANVHLESIELTMPPQTPTSPLSPPAPHLTGTVLVRNIAFEKDVAIRFTLDDWQTTSEVRAKYKDSCSSRPWERQTLGDTVAAIASGGSTASWDRFSFIIRLEDHAYKLHERVLWMVIRYTVGGGQQWWDNNSNNNYRVAFKIASPESRRTISAPEPALKPTVPSEVFGAGFDFATALSYRPKELPEINTAPNTNTTPSPSSSTSSLSRGPSVTSKLNLSNYISPATSPTTSTLRPIRSPTTRSPVSRSPQPSSPSLGTPPSSDSPEPNVLATPRANFAKRPTFQLSAVKPDTGLTLRWPWGSSTSSIHSPHKLSPLSSPALTTPLPAGSDLPTPQQEKPNEDLYQAMVQQWCFAQSPGPGPGPSALGAEGVLVG